jgi:hypothetical protein
VAAKTELEAIASSNATVSDKIRALNAAGVPRAEIARMIDRRYQHVRNVLEDDARRDAAKYTVGAADLSGVREQGVSYEPPQADDRSVIERRGRGVYWLRVRPDGTLPLPAEFVAALAASPGRRVFAQLESGAVTIESAEAAMNRAREIVRKYIPPGGPSIVDEFLAERRTMWGEEDD